MRNGPIFMRQQILAVMENPRKTTTFSITLLCYLHAHLKQLFTRHLHDACPKTSDIIVIKMMTSAQCQNQNTLFDLIFAVIVRN